MKLIEELIKEKNLLLERLKQIEKLIVLYSIKDTHNTTAESNVLNAIKVLGKTDTRKISHYLGKNTKTIDNILRSLVKEKRIEVVKEGKKNLYNIRNND